MKTKLFSLIFVFVLVLTACAPGKSVPDVDATATPNYPATISALQSAATATPNYLATIAALQTGQPAPADAQPTAQSAQPTNVAPVNSGSDTSAYEGTDACKDGEILPNVLQNVPDVPFGRNEGAVVAEIGFKPGNGFAGWGRFIAIAERVQNGRMPYANDVLTVHAVQYCGDLAAIEAWAPTHVTAMVNSSQDSSGKRPSVDEIPIVLLNNDGTITIVKAAPNGPSMDEIKAHLEMRP